MLISLAGVLATRSDTADGYRLPVALASSLDSTAAHYVSVKVVIRPLSADDLGEIEDWLSGRHVEGGSPGTGEDRGLPAYLLEWAVNLSGLGDRSAQAKGERFVPRLLAAPR